MGSKSTDKSGPRQPLEEVPSVGESLHDPFDQLLAEAIERSGRGTERKQVRSRRTEQQILHAALRVFARDGISRSRIADIAAEAGISTSTLYEYYASKEDLAYEVPSFHLATFFEEYRTTVAGTTCPRERLLMYLSMSADFARQHPDWARLLYLEIWPSVFVGATVVRHSVDDFARILIFILRQGSAEGHWSNKHDPYQTAAILLGGVNQIIITWLLYRRPKNLTRAGVEMAERILHMIEAES